MNINFTYMTDPIPTGIVRFIAYKPLPDFTLEEVVTVEFDPPHINPRDVSMYVPSPVTHIIRAYEAPDSMSVGIKTAEYIAVPSYDGPSIVPPMMVKVGGGRTGEGMNGAVDPVDGADGVAIPAMVGNTISWVEQRGAGPLKGPNDVEGLSSTELEWIPRVGGGIDLQNGKIFYQDEEYWFYFEPRLDSNVSSAIADIAALLELHINDKDNPHEVDKADVGLGNLPNATSDLINLNSSVTLATSAAVYALAQSISNSVKGSGSAFIGNIGAVVPNANVINVVNNGGNKSAVTIQHNLGVADNYLVVGGIGSGAGSYFNDSNVTWAWRDATPNSFALILQETTGTTQNVFFHFALIKQS